MDADDVGKVVTAMEHVETSVEVLRDRGRLEESEYLNDREARDVVERRFETAIQACIDIARVFVRDAGREMPDTNRETVAELAPLGVVSEETAAELQAAVGFRNVLAHQYGVRIDDELVYARLDDLDLFVRYLEEVYEHLDAESYF
jgi:uncharacterized protein YutE (UPF0331/DUF86 family)